MKELKGKGLLLVGFTLFSMFFGAGNLIFPPFMAAQAGASAWPAFAGFALSAVGLPILGVVAVAKAGGLPALAQRVHPAFSTVFTILAYLSIGPCLAIPRTAGTSFEMAVTPFVSSGAPITMLRVGYSILFFGVALLVALRPDKLTDRLGKILCPTLLVLIVAIFVGCITGSPAAGYGPASAAYAGAAPVQGFLDGYQTMDTIAALNFGIIIALNIRARGIADERAVIGSTVRAGWVAGAVLLAVYAMLTHIGALSGAAYPGAVNGTETMTWLVSGLFGKWGSILLAAVFVIACFNTCVGLISCCSAYFSGLLPRFTYKMWAAFFAFVSMVVSNAGLNAILRVSVPVLSAIYPVAIVLIVLALLHHFLEGNRFIYPVTIACTGVASVLYALASAKLPPAFLRTALEAAPLASVGLGWVLPAAVGAAAGLLLAALTRKKTT